MNEIGKLDNLADYVQDAIDQIEGICTNKEPHIEMLKYSDRTESTMKITVMARDENKEQLTYKLFVGTSKDNLAEQTEIKEKVEQGQEVSWTVPVVDKSTIYYYKVVIKDSYAEIDSGIRKTNNAPVLGIVEIEKDLEENIGNWVRAKVKATDEENDKLTYIFKMWKKVDGATEEELILREPTKVAIKENANAGEEIELTINKRFRRIYRLCI